MKAEGLRLKGPSRTGQGPSRTGQGPIGTGQVIANSQSPIANPNGKSHVTGPACKVLHGDCREVLKQLETESVQCVVTSPPYWQLRDYGAAGQIGLEPTLEEYLQNVVGVFREVRRVLRKDGTLWLNMGDVYAGGGMGGGGGFAQDGIRMAAEPGTNKNVPGRAGSRLVGNGIKRKDLVGLPWRVAFALQEDGWWLRAEIIWNKPNAMPESVLDRPTRAHEQIFLFSKSAKYFYDAHAICEPCESGHSDMQKMFERRNRISAKHLTVDPGPLPKANPRTNIGRKRSVGGLRFAMGTHGRNSRMYKDRDRAHLSRSGNKERSYEGRLNHRAGWIPWEGLRRNKRSVWSIATTPYKGAHFAVFPKALAEICILAGSRRGMTVLDPFGGSGTVGKVALSHGRSAILIELQGDYLPLIHERINGFSKQQP